MGDDGITYLGSIDYLTKSQVKELLLGKVEDLFIVLFIRFICLNHIAFETKTLNIEVNKNDATSKIMYTAPLNTNIWAYHDSRLWLHGDRKVEPTNDLSPALVE